MVVWPQIVMIIYFSATAGIGLMELCDGKTKEARTTFIGTAIVAFILYAGGFWNVLLNGPVLGRLI